MFLTGTYQRNLDEKCRFAIPKRVRDTLDPSGNLVLYMAPGTDGSLVVYTEQVFAQLGDHLGQGPLNGQEVRAFSRMFYAQAQRVEADRQGRARIPVELAALASLKKEIVLLGVRDHLEIWNRESWETYLSAKQPYYDDIAEGAFGKPPGASGFAPPTTPTNPLPPQPR
jgi:MraZ protein